MTAGRMPVHDALRGRRTVHDYRQDAVPDAVVEQALEAAILAPNHRLTFPWRFTRVGRETRTRIAEIALELKRRKARQEPAGLAEQVRRKILDPHELIVVSLLRNADPAIAREDYASAACAIQNLHLSLYADGVGSKWSTGGVTTDPRTYAILGIDSAVQEIIGFVWVGLPQSWPNAPKRPPLGDVVRRLP